MISVLLEWRVDGGCSSTCHLLVTRIEHFTITGNIEVFYFTLKLSTNSEYAPTERLAEIPIVAHIEDGAGIAGKGGLNFLDARQV